MRTRDGERIVVLEPQVQNSSLLRKLLDETEDAAECALPIQACALRTWLSGPQDDLPFKDALCGAQVRGVHGQLVRGQLACLSLGTDLHVAMQSHLSRRDTNAPPLNASQLQQRVSDHLVRVAGC